MASSIKGNGTTWTVVFEDAAGGAINPDADTDIIWTVYAQDQSTVRATETQALADATATGTFVFDHTPTVVETIYVQVAATVDGEAQVARSSHTVTWT